MHGASVWAYNPMYGSDPIYLQSYVVGEIVARQIFHKIDQKFGRRWSTEAGTYLRAHFYSRGARQTLDALMQDGTGEPLIARYLIEDLREAGSARPLVADSDRVSTKALSSRSAGGIDMTNEIGTKMSTPARADLCCP